MNVKIVQKPLSMEDFSKYKKASDQNLDIYISLKNQYVYMMVSKAASSTVTYHLQFAEYRGTRFTVQDVNNRYMSPHLAPFQLKPEEFLRIMQAEDFKKITFVRNPYSRLLSCYLHRIVGNRRSNPSKKVLGRRFGISEFRDLTFARFIDLITDMESLEMERHWAVQHDAVMYPMVDYAFIGRQETLAQDLRALEKLLFGAPAFDLENVDGINKSPMQTSATGKLRQYYSDAVMRKVADRYRIDFETFGYDTDLPAA